VLNGFARLRPGVTIQQAQAEMDVLNRQYAAAHPNPFEKDAAMRLAKLQDRLVSNVRAMLWTLAGAVAFVLLIACANVAGLLMARSNARSREFALRASLGAPRSRLIAQLLVESGVLAAAGGILGLVLAYWALGAIRLADAVAMSSPVMPLSLPGAAAIRLDGTVLLFTIALSWSLESGSGWRRRSERRVPMSPKHYGPAEKARRWCCDDPQFPAGRW